LSSFASFGETCAKIAATSSKLRKIEEAAAYLQMLDEEELPIAARLLSGHIFPKHSSLEVFVGGSMIIESAMEVLNKSKSRKWDELSETYRKYGDLGEALEELMQKKLAKPLLERTLSLKDVYRVFESLAGMSGPGSSSRKRAALVGLYLDSQPSDIKYIVKLITGELRIGLVEGLVVDSLVKAFHVEVEDVRAALLVRGDIGEVATLARNKQLHTAKITPLHPVAFMLAETAETPQEVQERLGKKAYAEYKYDGIRAQIHKLESQVSIFSRRLEDISRYFPEITEDAAKLRNNMILDGEILPFKGNRPLPFQALQQRLRRKTLGSYREDVPVVYFAFDILYSDNEETIDLPLSERKTILEKSNLDLSIRLAPYKQVNSSEEIELLFRESRELRYEGLVIKDPESSYRPGKRGAHWIKLKEELDTLDVVIVATEYGHGKRAGLLSDYTFAVRSPEGFRVVGKAYSGLTDEEIAWMTGKLNSLVIDDYGYRKTVQPKIVLEVAFNNIQRSSRHDSGYALRFPRIKSIRHDKSAEDIDTLDRVRSLYESERVKGATR
jgi:DNA ligase-1